MNTSDSMPHAFPDTSLVSQISLDEIDFPGLRFALDYWRERRDKRRFPSREDIEPRSIVQIMNNTSIIKVIDGGADYEHRIVGDAVAQAFRPNLHGRRLSEIIIEAPLLVGRLRDNFQAVVEGGEPRAVRAWVGYDHPEVNFTQLEAIILPLGKQDDSVDHLMTVCAFGMHA